VCFTPILRNFEFGLDLSLPSEHDKFNPTGFRKFYYNTISRTKTRISKIKHLCYNYFTPP